MASVTGIPPSSSASEVFRTLPIELVLMIADEMISSTTSALKPQYFEFGSSDANPDQLVIRRTSRHEGDSARWAKERYLQIRTILQINQRIRKAAYKGFLPFTEDTKGGYISLEKDVFILNKYWLFSPETFQHLTPWNIRILESMQNAVLIPYDSHYWGTGSRPRVLKLMKSVNSISIISSAFETLAVHRKRRLKDGQSLGLVPWSEVLQDPLIVHATGFNSFVEMKSSLARVLGRLKGKDIKIFLLVHCRHAYEERTKENSFEIVNNYGLKVRFL